MYVYILSSLSGTIYIGVTNNLQRRTNEHKQKIISGFSSKYNCVNLIYFEIYDDPGEAIEREKQLKRWNRIKKEELIRSLNPIWMDLSVYLPDKAGT